MNKKYLSDQNDKGYINKKYGIKSEIEQDMNLITELRKISVNAEKYDC